MITYSFKKIHPKAELPNQAHTSDVGYDLKSIETLTLRPRSVTKIHTGIELAGADYLKYSDHQDNVFMKIEGRSGLASKGIFPVGGIIDSATYRGEIIVLLHNSTDESFSIKEGDKCAQFVFYHHAMNISEVEIKEVEVKTKTERGENGFGSTGN
jgi:dUTP pyrophosphatase